MRIVSIAPSITETIFALGAEYMLVGVTDFCNYPVEALKKNSVGGFASPDLNRILELEPDVLISTTFHRLDKLQPIANAGIQVFQIEGQELFDAPDMIIKVGEIIGKSEKANILAKEIEADIDNVIGEVSTKPKVKVCYLCTSTNFCSNKPRCKTNNLVEKLGGELTLYEKDNLAISIHESQPEVIIIPYSEGTKDYKIQKEFFDNKPILKDTPAYINNKFYSMNGELLSRPGPRAAEGFRQLYKLIHK